MGKQWTGGEKPQRVWWGCRNMSKVNKSADGKKSGGNWGKVKISGSLTPRPQPPNQIDITPKNQIHLSSQQIYDATASCSSRRCTHQWYKGELSKTSHHGIACPRTTTKGAPKILMTIVKHETHQQNSRPYHHQPMVMASRVPH